MALDRQRILGELGSVMKQLQSADCGCLGKIFGGPQQSTPQMGSPLPTCGGCRRSCCHSHGCGYNITPTPVDAYPQQPISGNTFGFGPQIANMMKGEQKPQTMPGQGRGPLSAPMVIDAPQSPHGKVGLTPFVPNATQHGQFNPASVNHGDVSGQMQQQFIPQNNPIPTGNVPMSSWPQTTKHYAPTTQSNPHGQHSQGIAKFNQMFPGVQQGLGGDLGFDPMAIAIQMNPDNRMQAAIDTMHQVMNGNKGVNNMVHSPTIQPGIGGTSSVPQNYISPNAMMQQNPQILQQVPTQNTQNNVNQISNPLPPPNQNLTHSNQSPANLYGQPIPQQNQQIYAAVNEPSSVNQQMFNAPGTRQMLGQQQQNEQQQITNFNSEAPNLPVTYEEATKDLQPLDTQRAYTTEPQAPQVSKEPILPADTSKKGYYELPKHQGNYGYNTLGQPVEMLPAKMFHPPEPSLPQTLSPQPVPVKPKVNLFKANVKSTISKTSLMGNKPVGRIPSRNQLQHIYNQYKGSQSFTQQSVRHPTEGTYSEGKLNVPAEVTTPVPVERVGGDTVVNNSPREQVQVAKEDQGQIGDTPRVKPGGDSIPVKEAPVAIKKCRNGLQDMVFSSYPTSTAWTFHGHGRAQLLPDRYRSRRY